MEVQDVSFGIEYIKEKDNLIADALIRRTDQMTNPESRTIFLQLISMEKVKEQGYHPLFEITEAEKKKDGKWYYRGKLLVEKQEEKKPLMKRFHKDKRAGHPSYKETLRKIAEVAFWNQMRKEIGQYIQKCSECQLKQDSQKTGFQGEVARLEQIWKMMSIDHITKLSKVKGKNSIRMIQDQFSGMIYLKAISEKEDIIKV